MSPGLPPKKPSFKFQMTDNFNYKVLSLIVTLILWVAALGKKDFQEIVMVPVQPLLFDSIELVELEPREVEVKLVGKRKPLMRLDNLHYVLNLSNHEPGTHIETLNMDYLALPTGVEVKDVNPKIIKFILRSTD